MSERESSTAALLAMYSADRDDMNALGSLALQLVAAMLIVAGVSVSAVSQIATTRPHLVLVIPAIAWGLASYLAVVNALASIRNRTIDPLERRVLALIAEDHPSINPAILAGSNAGDWAAHIDRQPLVLKACTVASFGTALLGLVGATVLAVVATAPEVSGLTTAAAAVAYSLYALVLVSAFWFIGSRRLDAAFERAHGTA